MRRSFALVVPALFALLGVAPALPLAPDAGVPAAETIFAQAKGVWRARVGAGPAYVRYSLLERYTWRRRVHDNWWHAAYRDRDHEVSLRRLIVPADEAARLHGMSITLNYHIHNGSARADTLDTNPDADAFPILDPIVAPNASFGLARGEAKADLSVGSRDGTGRSRLAEASPTPSSSPSPIVESAPAPVPLSATEKPLRELVRVEAVARDYAIAYAGTERVRNQDAYHLTLVPLREPRTYRLRELWVAVGNYETLRLTVEGLFSGRPYDEARWTVTFVDFGGLAYVQQIRAEDTLRFGLDRYVSGLEYDFVDYSFPESMSPLEFDRLL